MGIKVIRPPHRLKYASDIFSMNLELIDLDSFDEIHFDFRKCTYGEPFAMLLLATQIKSIIGHYRQKKFVVLYSERTNFCGYAKHIGFFQFMGFDLGNPVNYSKGTKNYTPFHSFDIGKIIEDAEDQPIGKHVMSMSRNLAEVLCQRGEGPIFDLFEYCFREIIRNSAEHSKGKKVVVLAQCWPQKDEAEIVIADDGVGIAENLYDNEYIECDTNSEALKFALLPGISGVRREDRFNQDEVFGNSGFGLYVTSRFCSERGSFRIISKTDGLTLARGRQNHHDWQFNGTCIQMRFSTSSAAHQTHRIDEIIEEGKEEYSAILKEFPIRASIASGLLASHFDKMNLE